MSLVLILSCLWVIASSIVAFLPMRSQFIPGLALLLVAPLLIIWIGMVHGWIWTGVAILALASMFRRPLWAVLRQIRAAS
ncbi:DUF2484 family protein [Aliiroseovarius lamellibrachiae]|uniref:DUF2484 family protein n=1 Tax=Aliiroseovarius lamellibrachiae TaxID=1924933 RepID=UPI001BE02A62|nr:DUF2484 family protein [Aliiroseovarius lamellibrachiae]MBT2131066.1 DUF2484 family protein [Aliiroseovarius lamellibrachiae]